MGNDGARAPTMGKFFKENWIWIVGPIVVVVVIVVVMFYLNRDVDDTTPFQYPLF